jgi:acetyltransferase
MTTFGGGSGVMATDQAGREGLGVPMLMAATREKLEPLLTPLAAIGNPVDLTPQSVNDPKWRALLPEALGVIADDPGIDSFLFLVGGLGHRSADLADLVEGLRKRTEKPVVMSWLFGPQRAIDDLARRGIFVFPEHARAARAIGKLARHTAQKNLRIGRTESYFRFDWAAHVPADGPQVISENAVAGILAAAGLAVAPGALATSPAHAAEIAAKIGMPVVAKGISGAITHRAAAGFVTLGLTSPEAASAVDRRYRERAAEMGVAYDGTWVQRMVEGNREFLVTAVRDPDFGVVVGVGIGGAMTEIIDDVTFARAPIGKDGAFDLLGELATLRKRPDFLSGTQRDLAAAFIARFSELVATAPWPRFTLEVNPLKLGTDSVQAVDGLLIVEADD